LALVAAALAAAAVVMVVGGVFSSGSPGSGATVGASTQPPTQASSGSHTSATQTATAAALKAFDSKEDAICAQARQQSAAIGPPTQGAQLATWANKALAVSTRVFTQFSALTPPADLANPFQRFLAGLQLGLTQLRALAAAATAGNSTLFVQLASQPAPAAETADATVASSHGIGCVQPAAAAPAQPSADAAAEELAHTAQTTIETYATDNSGSYAKATAKTLHQYEHTLQVGAGGGNAYIPTNGVEILDGGKGYVLTANATNGDTFSIERAPSGIVTRSCSTPTGHASAACPASHTW
jgi:hypothetical protein